jgi:hypothetical protein
MRSYLLVWIMFANLAGCESRQVPTGAAARASKQRVLEACAFAGACTPSVLPSECVSWFAYPSTPFGGSSVGRGHSMLERLVECAPAKDCETFIRCYGGSWVAPTTCRMEGRCKNGKLEDHLTSGPTAKLFFDCNALGGTCEGGCCLLESCPSSGSSITCHPSSKSSTVSTKGTRCKEGALMDFDCSSRGQVCSTTDGCKGGGPSCDPETFEDTCTGNVARYCVANPDGTGNIASLDCNENAFASRCSPYLMLHNEPCGPAGFDCEPWYQGECQGSRLLVCVNGFKTPVDCRAIGFDTCGEGDLFGHKGCM